MDGTRLPGEIILYKLSQGRMPLTSRHISNVPLTFRRMLKVYKKIHRFMEVLNYFTTKEWTFTNDHVHALVDKLDNKDRSIFSMDMRDVVWDTYFQNYMRGIRLYLIKDPIETLPQARVKWQRYAPSVHWSFAN
jgi:hypothetical protein